MSQQGQYYTGVRPERMDFSNSSKSAWAHLPPDQALKLAEALIRVVRDHPAGLVDVQYTVDHRVQVWGGRYPVGRWTEPVAVASVQEIPTVPEGMNMAQFAKHCHDVLGLKGSADALNIILVATNRKFGEGRIDMHDLKRRDNGFIRHTDTCGCPVPNRRRRW